MENVFETNEKIYNVLGYEKCGLLLGKNLYLPENKRGNCNTLSVSGSGTGKIAAFTIPNILNMLGSYVVTDPWGEIYEKTHEYLEQNGYKIKTINYNNSVHNYDYNPLNHIFDDTDVNHLTNILIGNVDDRFIGEACKCLLKSLIYYVLDKSEKKDLLTCFKLLSIWTKEDLFDNFDELSRESVASKYYSILKSLPNDAYENVVSTVLMKLSFVINTIPEGRDYSYVFNFDDLATDKIAIFLVNKEDNIEDQIYINIFLSQLLTELHSNNVGGHFVYFLLNEVGTFGNIYELSRALETAKARKLSINLITNDLQRLAKIYGDDYGTIMNTIDTKILFGTALDRDIEYFSNILSVDKHFIRSGLDPNQILIHENGLKPIIAEKDYFFYRNDWKNI